MIEIVTLCSGRPGSEPLECPNEAVVRLVWSRAWQRPMCEACAKAFEAHLREQELPPGKYIEIDQPRSRWPI